MILHRPVSVQTITMVVTGNTATAIFTTAGGVGHIRTLIFGATGFTFDYTITDPQGQPISGQATLSGTTTIVMDRPCQAINTILLANATNGTYTVELYIEPGV